MKSERELYNARMEKREAPARESTREIHAMRNVESSKQSLGACTLLAFLSPEPRFSVKFRDEDDTVGVKKAFIIFSTTSDLAGCWSTKPCEALLELYNPELTVFSKQAFPNGRPPSPDPNKVEALSYARKHIRLDNNTLVDGDGASGDPASLGVSAILIGQTDPKTAVAVARQYAHFGIVPRWPNGAISHRDDYPELWADFIYMAPPFFAYYATSINSTDVIRQAVAQCLLYRQVLQPNASSGAVSAGAWRHIIGPKNQDLGLWSTGNAWAAMGMARVLATLVHWSPTATEASAQIAQADFFTWIGQILKAAMNSPKQDGLLRNYLNDTTCFGETSGTALMTAAVYRLAVLQQEARALFDGSAAKAKKLDKIVTSEMLKWAETNRKTIAAHIDQSGIAKPAVNPLGWGDRTPYVKGSPEGQSFVVMLYAAWRDCLRSQACKR